ncbi:MAG TPA: methyltransferase domain-containing protein [Mycobacteriales bacterium]
MSAARYDTLGVGYAEQRRADPRIAAQIWAALDGATRVVNVGAGAGSYEPETTLVAVEPSAVMIAQRPAGSAPVVRAVAEALPLPAGCGDAGMACLTVHHWADPARGLAELVRVAPARTVILCWDRRVTREYWLFRDYLPEIMQREADLPDANDVAAVLESLGRVVGTSVVPVPRHCLDGTAAAYWRRPEAYLDPDRWAAMSGVALLDPSVRRRGLDLLRADLADGSWARRNAALLSLESYDAGFRLVAATPG